MEIQARDTARPTAPFGPPGAHTTPDDMASTFEALIDVVNPLQHLPLVGPLYRAVTDDAIDAPARLVGGALYGGVFGFLTSLGSALYESVTGESVEATVLSLFREEGEPARQHTALPAYEHAQMMSVDEMERRPVSSGRLLTIEA